MSGSAASAAITHEQLKPMEEQQTRPFRRVLLRLAHPHQPSAVRPRPAT